MVVRCRLLNDSGQWLANVIVVKEEQLNSYIGTLILKNAESHTTWLYSNIEDLDAIIEDLAKRALLQDYYQYEVLENIEL
jgi:hypothetical protein